MKKQFTAIILVLCTTSAYGIEESNKKSQTARKQLSKCENKCNAIYDQRVADAFYQSCINLKHCLAVCRTNYKQDQKEALKAARKQNGQS